MNNQAATGTSRAEATLSKSLQLAAAFLLGAVILYGAGFTAVGHNAAHDTRHSQGFPCH